MQDLQKPPTLKDVARIAGVSPALASAAINGSRSNTLVSDATRRRILAVAEEMRYSPNILARGLKNVSLNLLGVTFPFETPMWITADHYGSTLLTGIITGVHKAGFNTAIFHRPWQDAKRSAAGFRGQGIDGFVVVAPAADSDMVSGLVALGIPLVVIASPADQHHVPSVAVDNVLGVNLALDHLITLGHRHIAHITRGLGLYDPDLRRDTYLEMMRGIGVTEPERNVHLATPREPGMQDEHIAYGTARELLTAPDRPTAVFAVNDGCAIATMDAARDLGIRIPQELSVIGFDDHPSAERMTPPLTTLRQPLLEIGEAAADLLVAVVRGERIPPRTRFFPPELVIRGSTAVPKP